MCESPETLGHMLKYAKAISYQIEFWLGVKANIGLNIYTTNIYGPHLCSLCKVLETYQ